VNKYAKCHSATPKTLTRQLSSMQVLQHQDASPFTLVETEQFIFG